MTQLIIGYFIKVVLIQGVFFGFYWLVLRNRTNHGLNRSYLIITLMLTLIIPTIENPFGDRVEPMIEPAFVESWLAIPIENMSPDSVHSEKEPFPIWRVVIMSYLITTLVFFAKSIFYLHVLQKIKKQCEYVKRHWFKLFKTSHAKPFSFFSSVFIPEQIFGTSSFDQILAHECVHVRQMHSLDRLLVDFLVALFWFNPFIYLYRNALIEVHEFQADAQVIDKFKDPVAYQEILFAQLQPSTYSGLVSHFNFSTIKKRIVMMNKTKDSRRSQLAYLLTIPVISLVIFSFTAKKGEQSVNHITDRLEVLAGPFDPPLQVIEGVGAEQATNKPSILPLKMNSKFRVTSGFGMRKDPLSGKERRHFGIDLSCEVGTEVIATADGVVSEIVDQKDGYGKMLSINHGEMYVSRYSQLSEFRVKKGDEVQKGQVIALSGNSGRSTGPHLHYEVHENEKPVDPMKFVKNYKFSEVIQMPAPPPTVNEPKMGKLSTDGEVHEHVAAVIHEAPESNIGTELASVEEAREIAEVDRTRAEAAIVYAGRTSAKKNEKHIEEGQVAIADKAAVLSYKEATIARKISELEAKIAMEAADMKRANEQIRIRVEEKISSEKEKEKNKEKEKKKKKDKKN